mgnify:CR=1 FL=1
MNGRGQIRNQTRNYANNRKRSTRRRNKVQKKRITSDILNELSGPNLYTIV